MIKTLSPSHPLVKFIADMPKSKKKDPQRSVVKPTKKRLRLQSSSDEEYEQPAASPQTSSKQGSSSRVPLAPRPSGSQNVKKAKKDREERGEKEKKDKVRAAAAAAATVDIQKWKQKFVKAEAERKKLTEKLACKRLALCAERDKVTNTEKRVAKLRKDLIKSRKSTDKANKEKDEAVKEVKEEATKMKKKIESLKQKSSNLELEKAKLESKLSSLDICAEPKAGSSSGAQGGSGLFQDMMDNFRELAETQLQCAVCSEVFVEATAINCGHTFCHFCIHEWKKKKSNCPVCRTDIKQIVAVKVLDEYADKMYEQFVSEGGRAARTSLQEERLKLRKEAEREAGARLEQRRQRAERRRGEEEEDTDIEDGRGDGSPLEMVNIVLNRARRRMEDTETETESVDTDATLELHLSDDVSGVGNFSDTDSEVDIVPRLLGNNSLWLSGLNDSDTDSDDEDFQAEIRATPRNDDNDTDSLSDSSDSESSQSSSDSSSDSDSD